MKFSIYGRFQVEVRRENDSWVVYRSEMGKRAPDEIAIYLDDVFHEFAGIGQRVEQLLSMDAEILSGNYGVRRLVSGISPPGKNAGKSWCQV